MASEKPAMVPLRSVLKRIEAGWSPTCEPYAPAPGEWGVLSLGAITSGQFRPDQAKRLPSSTPPRTHLEVKSKDVLIARANGSKALVGIGCVVPEVRERLLLPDLILRLVPDQAKMEAEYLGLVLSSPMFRHQVEASMRSTSGQFKISQADLRGFLVPELPISEQRRIVQVLDSFSENERSVRASISKQRTVRLGILLAAMNSITQDKSPEGWTRLPLKEVVSSAEYGISEALTNDPSGVPVLRMNNIRDGQADIGDLRYSPVPIPKRLRLRRRDVLFNRTNSIEHIGKAALWGDQLPKATFASYLVRLNPDKSRLLPEYLVEWLQHPLIRQRVKAISTVAVQQVNVNPTRLRELEIDLPVSLNEQERIVQALAACDERIRHEQDELAKLRQIKLGLADNLLAGKVQ